ncbi:MAG: hypothetical protein AB1595_00945 [bacterium]
MDIVEGLRKVIQELLVPELRVLQTEVKELSMRFEQMQKQTNERFEQMDRRFEQMQEQMDRRFNLVFKEFHSIREALGEISAKLDLSDRVSRIEGTQEEIKRELDRLFERKSVSIA